MNYAQLCCADAIVIGLGVSHAVTELRDAASWYDVLTTSLVLTAHHYRGKEKATDPFSF
jgi:hypothetical protein